MNHKGICVALVCTFVLSGCTAGFATNAYVGVKQKSVQDGTYEGKAESYSVESEMNLRVTFQDNQITSIETIDAGSNANVYQTVEERFYPRIIESQSLAVDNITGATVSSNAARTIIKSIIDENGGDSSEWMTPIAKSTEVVQIEDYDVIVVGLGASGIASYLSAASQGVSVFGLDSAGKLGGNGAMSAGAMAINPSRQVELNQGQPFVDRESLIQDWLEYTDNDAKEDLVREFINESGNTIDWLENQYDFQFGNKMFSFYHPKLWNVWTMYADKTGVDKDHAYINSMKLATSKNPKNAYELELTADGFLLNKSGDVIGVKATRYDGAKYKIYGKSIILATGGYIGNPQMSKQYTGYTWHTHAMTQCKGAGIQMATSIGGALYNPDVAVENHIAQLSNIIRDDEVSADDKAILTSLLLDNDAVLVDKQGNLFRDKVDSNLSFNAWKAGDEFYAIYNADDISAIKTVGMDSFNKPLFLSQGGNYVPKTPIPNIEAILSMGESYNDVVVAESIGGLSNALGIRLNIKNVHGKTSGKFYAIKGAAYVYSSTGGVDVDAQFNLLTNKNESIENVFVVGNDSIGVLFASEKAYPTYGGIAQGYALTSGRLAGQNAAIYCNQKQ
ncbi:MAG: FAD-binding protein [Erysipelotrichaceae bacterium]|nr:FAD-binding protein [Erysipelotrichaceae bacterium]MDY6035108.1 FAD-binding protein [Bulleidia sp.]